MALNQQQKETLTQLLDESVAFHTRLKETLIWLAEAEAYSQNNATLREVTLATREQFYDLGSYIDKLATAIQKPNLRIVSAIENNEGGAPS